MPGTTKHFIEGKLMTGSQVIEAHNKKINGLFHSIYRDAKKAFPCFSEKLATCRTECSE